MNNSTNNHQNWKQFSTVACIDGHVCWNGKRHLPFIVCRPRKTNFRFPFAANKGKLPFSISSGYVYILYIRKTELYININIHTYTYMYIYTAVCSSYKRKLSVCKRTKRIKLTCPSMTVGVSIVTRISCLIKKTDANILVHCL